MRKESFILLLAFAGNSVFAQDSLFRPTYSFDGVINIKKHVTRKIHLSFLILLDSTMVGSYYYSPGNGSLKLIGQITANNSFEMVERTNADSIAGYFKGTLTADKTSASGKWISSNSTKSYDFKLTEAKSKSFWDYIRKNRALHEYNNIDLAVKEFEKVLSIDVQDQNFNTLPNELSNLKRILSINLLGNEFTTFPVVLSKLKTLTEISLSSNKLISIDPSISELKNLRILILNRNRLSVLPKEIGKLSNLMYLEIGNNMLTALPDEIKYLTQLQVLHVEDNNLDEIEKEKIKRLLPKCVIYF